METVLNCLQPMVELLINTGFQVYQLLVRVKKDRLGECNARTGSNKTGYLTPERCIRQKPKEGFSRYFRLNR